MRVLITGAAGFVGRAAIEVFRPAHQLRLLDIAPVVDEADMVVGDIADYAT
ncbi:MAG: NAD(P)-dependent oxidoreductase, partial [Chloroflexi bacterium]|nr:NAD(P)-dependent oxidoreductase [Chloroflexota bacterium]